MTEIRVQTAAEVERYRRLVEERAAREAAQAGATGEANTSVGSTEAEPMDTQISVQDGADDGARGAAKRDYSTAETREAMGMSPDC
ncbi:uncharacterized protein MONBRDRAFT_33920 [Monosiga brevicollis MX1]|uniref:Uncharacterized protein n=1 Tax=Monosiga brevicollis TaxID=81824 RepID=A9V8H0_MONBE|nr:uncharacterized protein MONBRDRAFT_33920 [Monosiga brevicollis MX1]EDQ86143.1 predicted protein [Monosiga brevicollis MX1]|eukprot:XP_001749068.1 hypothetical protein [Monosiga brevicollis MX1]